MPISTRGTIGANVLQTKVASTIIKNLEPNLYFYDFGVKPDANLNGFGTITWLAPSKLSISVATATITEGTNPASQAFSINAIIGTPTQYGLYVELSDRLIKASPVNVMNLAATEVGNNLARVIDQVVQTEVMAGTKVLYANAKANRAALAATDIMTETDVKKCNVFLRTSGAKDISGDYVCIAHTYQTGDLRSTSGMWMEASKYTTPDKLFNGETGKIHGTRFVESGNVQTFASTTTVYPALFIGQQAYGVADFSSLEAVMKPLNIHGGALNLVAAVGAKIDFVAKRLNEGAMIRLETGAATYPV